MDAEDNAQPQGAAVNTPAVQDAADSAQALTQPSPSGEDLDLEDELVDYNEVDSLSSPPRNKGKDAAEVAETADVEQVAPAPKPQHPAQEDLDRTAALRAYAQTRLNPFALARGLGDSRSQSTANSLQGAQLTTEQLEILKGIIPEHSLKMTDLFSRDSTISSLSRVPADAAIDWERVRAKDLPVFYLGHPPSREGEDKPDPPWTLAPETMISKFMALEELFQAADHAQYPERDQESLMRGLHYLALCGMSPQQAPARATLAAFSKLQSACMAPGDLLDILERESKAPAEQAEHAEEILGDILDAERRYLKTEAAGTLNEDMLKILKNLAVEKQRSFFKVLKNEFKKQSDLRVTAAHLSNQLLSASRHAQELRREVMEQRQRNLSMTLHASKEALAAFELAETNAVLMRVNAEINQELHKVQDELARYKAREATEDQGEGGMPKNATNAQRLANLTNRRVNAQDIFRQKRTAESLLEVDADMNALQMDRRALKALLELDSDAMPRSDKIQQYAETRMKQSVKRLDLIAGGTAKADSFLKNQVIASFRSFEDLRDKSVVRLDGRKEMYLPLVLPKPHEEGPIDDSFRTLTFVRDNFYTEHGKKVTFSKVGSEQTDSTALLAQLRSRHQTHQKFLYSKESDLDQNGLPKPGHFERVDPRRLFKPMTTAKVDSPSRQLSFAPVSGAGMINIGTNVQNGPQNPFSYKEQTGNVDPDTHAWLDLHHFLPGLFTADEWKLGIALENDDYIRLEKHPSVVGYIKQLPQMHSPFGETTNLTKRQNILEELAQEWYARNGQPNLGNKKGAPHKKDLWGQQGKGHNKGSLPEQS